MISFDSTHLRLIWSMVETYSHVLQDLSDDAICLWLSKKIKDSIHLSHAEMTEIKAYILSRSHLIRDVANSQGPPSYRGLKSYSSKGVELPYDKAV